MYVRSDVRRLTPSGSRSIRLSACLAKHIEALPHCNRIKWKKSNNNKPGPLSEVIAGICWMSAKAAW